MSTTLHLTCGHRVNHDDGEDTEYAQDTLCGQCERDTVSDIGGWYIANNGVCPTCHLDLRKLSPEADVYQHFAGNCVKRETCEL